MREKENVISFFNKVLVGVQTPYNDAIIISMIITKHNVKKVLVDNRSSIDILFYDTFAQANLSGNQLKRVSTPLVSFSRNLIRVKDKITLLVTIKTPTR